MAAHSPAPWVYYAGNHAIWGADDRAICVLSGPRSRADPEREAARGANALLIVAAPELLAKLREIHAGMVCSCSLQPFVDGPVPCPTCQIGALVATAEGL